MGDHDDDDDRIARGENFSTASVVEGFEAVMDPDKDPTSVKREASFGSCYANLVNSIMGAGILGLPYAYSKAGWLFGIIFQVMAIYFSVTGCQLLAFCASVTKQPASFYTIVSVVNKNLTFAVDSIIFCMTFGIGTAYLIIVGDLMPTSLETLGSSGDVTTRVVWVIIGWSIALPFSVMHNIDALKWTSGLCFLFLIFITVLAFVFAMPVNLDPCADQDLDDDDAPCRGETTVLPTDAVGLIKVFSIFIFALGCQTNVFAFLNELETPTRKRIRNLFRVSITSAAGVYVLFGCSSYSTYGDSIRSDSIVNYPANTLDAVARMFISFVVIFSYPLQINPGRRALLTLCQALFNKGAQPSVFQIRFRFFAISALYLGGTLMLGLLVTDLGLVFSLIGSIGSTMVMFIVPGYSYLSLFVFEGCEERRALAKDTQSLTQKLINDSNAAEGKTAYENLPVHEKSDFYVRTAWFQLIAGCIVMPVCLIAIFL